MLVATGHRKRLPRRAVLAVCIAGFASLACDQGTGPGAPAPPDGCEHVDYARGVQLVMNGTQLYRQLLATTEGTIEVGSGGVVSDIEAQFLRENGQPIFIANDCAINELRFEVEDPSMVEIRQDPAQRWFFDVAGLQSGSTRIRVLLWHDGHSHFRSELVPVNVAP